MCIECKETMMKERKALNEEKVWEISSLPKGVYSRGVILERGAVRHGRRDVV